MSLKLVNPLIVEGRIPGKIAKDRYFNLDSTDKNDFQQTFAAWRTVFLVTSGVYVVDSLAFIVLGKSEIQDWNNF